MELLDHDLLMRVSDTNPLLQKLYSEHLRLEKAVEQVGRYAAYSSSAALKQKELKKEKLKGMDTIMSILNGYRGESGMAAP